MTSAPSAQHQDQLTLFAADSLARTSAKPGKAPAWLARDRDCSTNCSESFAWWDRATSCWKTLQQSLTEEWTTFSERWPRQGTTRNGRAYRQRLWVPAISGTGGGALPTPKASDGERGRDKARARPDLKGRELATVLRDSLPTPRANSAMTVDLRTQQDRPELQPNLETVMAQMLHQAADLNCSEKCLSAEDGGQLPTPTTRDHKGKQSPGHKERGYGPLLPDALLPTGAATYLNPSFVEERMGFPVGWTDLKP